MDRKEFLKRAGLSAPAMFAIANLVSCSKSNPGVNSGGPVDFTIDLSDPANAQLNSNGGFIYHNGVIIARSSTGAFIAVSQTCTHQGATVQYLANQNEFVCPAHGSYFEANGSVLGGPAPASLRSYNTSLSGTSLRVYG